MGRPFFVLLCISCGIAWIAPYYVALDVPPDVGGHCIFRGYKEFRWNVLQQTESGNVNRYGGC